MSDQPKSTPASAQEIFFPAFMVGDKSTCRRKLKAEAKRWAKAYLAGCEFPEPKLVHIASGSVVFTDAGTADLVGLGYNIIPNTNIVLVDGEAARQEGRQVQCRAYTLMNLQFETEWAAELKSPNEEHVFRQSFAPFVCKCAWGTISIARQMCLFNSIEFTVPRIDALLRFWDALDQLKYVDLETYPVSLSTMLLRYFNGQLTMWVDHPSGNIRTDLQTAMEQMGHASPDEIYARLVRRLRECVDSMKDLENRDWLRSHGIIERGLDAKRQARPERYDDLTSGQYGELGGFLGSLGRHYGPGGDLTLP